jgi:hypothetical protein
MLRFKLGKITTETFDMLKLSPTFVEDAEDLQFPSMSKTDENVIQNRKLVQKTGVSPYVR